MKSLQCSLLHFKTEIPSGEFPNFRAALMDFTNNGYVPADMGSYPLAQLKAYPNHNGERRQPLLVCLGPKAVRLERMLCRRAPAKVFVNRCAYSMSLAKANAYGVRLQTSRHRSAYNLYNYQAMTSRQFDQFQLLDSDADKLSFLKERLEEHILSFARGTGWRIKIPVDIANLHLLRQPYTPRLDSGLPSFDLHFHSKLVLPGYIGLGREVAKGFGVLEHDKRGLN